MHERPHVLLMIDYHAQNPRAVRRLRERFPEAVFTVIKDQGSDGAFWREMGFDQLWDYHVSWPLRDKFRLLGRVRAERLDAAVFLGPTSDLRQLLVVRLSGARERIFLQSRGDSDPRARRVGILFLLGQILVRGGLELLFLPLLVFLRTLCKLGESGYFIPCPRGPDDPPLVAGGKLPPVSVVIPNYNGREMLRECLPSILSAARGYHPESEVIVVDDASSDRSPDVIREGFPEIRLLVHGKNQGFGKACHTGIEAARNDLVVLLNSDIAATDGFLPPLARHFRDHEVFSVQPKALGWDRKSLNFGLNVGRMERGYVRIWNESDTGPRRHVSRCLPTLYALGGAMAFDRRKYRALGGFDPLFRPFRWEDIDLCYRAQKRGWAVLYEPESIVFHKHHATLNKAFSPDYLNVVEIKNELLFTWKNIHERRWILEHFRRLGALLFTHLLSGRYNFAKALARAAVQLPEAARARALAKRQSRRADSEVLEKSLRNYRNFVRRGFAHPPDSRRQILIVNPVFPYPPIDGGKMRVYHTIREISRRHDVHLLCYIEPGQKPHLPEMRKICREVDTVDWPPPFGNLGRRWEGVFPMYCRGYYSDPLRDRLQKILADREIDLVQCEFDKTLFYVVFAGETPSLYVEHDVAPLFLRGGKNPPRRGVGRMLDWLEWMKAVCWEVEMGRRFTAVVALSEEDRAALKSFLPDQDVGYIKHGTCVAEYCAPYREVREKSLIFIGSYHHYPNRDAVVYFHREVWPLIRRRHPEASWKIVGSHADSEIQSFAREPGISVVGFVPDVRPHIRNAMVFIAPMRKGRGMKGKVLEAMAMAKPVVTTSIGAQGAEVAPGEHLLIGDTPAQLADAVDRLFTKPDLRKRLAEAGQELVRREYDWSRAADEMDRLYRRILG